LAAVSLFFSWFFPQFLHVRSGFGSLCLFVLPFGGTQEAAKQSTCQHLQKLYVICLWLCHLYTRCTLEI